MRPIGAWHRGVVLLDAPLHFREQRLLQRFGVIQRRLGVRVLVGQIGANFRVQRGRIAHHLAPVIRAQPRIVVGERHAVPDRSLGAALRARRGRQTGHALEHRSSAMMRRIAWPRWPKACGRAARRYPGAPRTSAPCRSCSNAAPWASGRRGKHGRDAPRSSGSVLRCAGSARNGPHARQPPDR